MRRDAVGDSVVRCFHTRDEEPYACQIPASSFIMDLVRVGVHDRWVRVRIGIELGSSCARIHEQAWNPCRCELC